ncbi:MAG TPA: 4'-phosphopantetheinyl transferase superfamily protein [Xanthomonadales bacterium]|nr:4'-phosphopantetheinyl transferase superfamily protein [Xanthomonadales bacterium]
MRSVAEEAQPLKLQHGGRASLADVRAAPASFAPGAGRVVLWSIAAASPEAMSSAADRRAVTARGERLVRELLAATLAIAPAALELAREPGGRPYVAFPPAAIAFSVAHSGVNLVLALSATRIGVDIEHRRKRPYGELAARAFVDSERAWVAAQEDRIGAFLRLWTAKEAVLKAAGVGIAGGLASVVVAARADRLMLRAAPAELGPREHWQLAEIESETGFPGCIACDAQVRCVDVHTFVAA